MLCLSDLMVHKTRKSDDHQSHQSRRLENQAADARTARKAGDENPWVVGNAAVRGCVKVAEECVAASLLQEKSIGFRREA